MGLLDPHERHSCRLGQADLVAGRKKEPQGTATDEVAVHASASPPYHVKGEVVEGPSGEPLHLSNVASWGPDMILFMGEFPDGRKWELVQHYSQVSMLLVAVKKMNEAPRRIGFELLKNVKEQDVPWEDPIS